MCDMNDDSFNRKYSIEVRKNSAMLATNITIKFTYEELET